VSINRNSVPPNENPGYGLAAAAASGQVWLLPPPLPPPPLLLLLVLPGLPSPRGAAAAGTVNVCCARCQPRVVRRRPGASTPDGTAVTTATATAAGSAHRTVTDAAVCPAAPSVGVPTHRGPGEARRRPHVRTG